MAIRKNFLFKFSILALFIFSFTSNTTLASEYTGINRKSALVTNSVTAFNHCGTINHDEIWSSADNVHTVGVGCSSVTIDNGTTLTITEGAIIKFDLDKSLIVNWTLLVLGTEVNPVYFTSYRDDTVGDDTNGDGFATQPIRGDWDRIEFTDTSNDASLIEHAVIRYAGAPGGLYYGAIRLFDASPLIQNTEITQNSYCAIEANLHSFPILSGNDIHDNDANGICIKSGTLDIDATWDITDTTYFLRNTVTIAIDKTLTIAPGVIIKMDYQGSLIINGGLSVQGTNADPIYFTSYKDDMVGGDTNGDGWSTGLPGDWRRIEFGDNSDDANSIINHAIIRYAGRDGYGAVTLMQAAPTIIYTILSDNDFAGLRASTSAPSLSCNDIYDNNIYGVANKTPELTVVAENHWWVL
jgi:hypothetical protein